MGQINPKTKCEQCDVETEAPIRWRQKGFCSPDCLNKAIDARDARVAELAVKPEEPAAEPSKPKKAKRMKAASDVAPAEAEAPLSE